jgi:hypothetical protein
VPAFGRVACRDQDQHQNAGKPLVDPEKYPPFNESFSSAMIAAFGAGDGFQRAGGVRARREAIGRAPTRLVRRTKNRQR